MRARSDPRRPDHSPGKQTMTTQAEVLATLEPIFRDILEVADLALVESLPARDVAEWNSLNHVRIISAAEQKFGVRLKAAELERLKTAGELAALIASKL